MPGGPETKSMASLAIRYRSAARSAGAAAPGRAAAACRVPGGQGQLDDLVDDGHAGVPVTTGTISASQAATSASLPAR